MTKQYFGDILECGDKRMDYEVEKPWKVDDIKLMTFKAKSAPSKETSISHGTDMVRAKEPGTYEFKHKSELKTTMHDNDVKLTISNKDFTLQSEREPQILTRTDNTVLSMLRPSALQLRMIGKPRLNSKSVE